VQMYKPSADWGRIRRAQDAVGVPVVANGDLFDPGSLDRCRAITGAPAYMLGRGAFRTPNLFRWMRGLDRGPWDPSTSAALLLGFAERLAVDARYEHPERAALNRLKGWVRALGEVEPAMAALFETLKRAVVLEDATRLLEDGFPGARATAPG
jgi:tRNA-dihydrouridine synthase C